MKGTQSMRVLVVSDTHGNIRALRQAIEEQPKARMIIHLGDGVREAQDMADAYPDKDFRLVRGNCDWGLSGTVNEVGVETVDGHRLFFTHGHHYQVKMGYYSVVCAAREQKADVLLFGHTHEPLTEYDDGLYILNPGSLNYGRHTYGWIDITKAGVVTHIVGLRS